MVRWAGRRLPIHDGRFKKKSASKDRQKFRKHRRLAVRLEGVGEGTEYGSRKGSWKGVGEKGRKSREQFRAGSFYGRQTERIGLLTLTIRRGSPGNKD